MFYHFQVIWRWIIVTLKKSPKVIQTGTIRKLGCGFLFAFHSNYDGIFNPLWDIQHQRIAWPSLKTELGVVQGHWKRRCSIDRSHTTLYWSAIVNINTRNLRSFITVKAHCSMTHLKQQKIISFLLVLHWAVDVIEVIYYINRRPDRIYLNFALLDVSLNNGP